MYQFNYISRGLIVSYKRTVLFTIVNCSFENMRKITALDYSANVSLFELGNALELKKNKITATEFLNWIKNE